MDQAARLSTAHAHALRAGVFGGPQAAVDPAGPTLIDTLPDRHTALPHTASQSSGAQPAGSQAAGSHPSGELDADEREQGTLILPAGAPSLISVLGTEESGQIGAYRLLERIGSGAMGRVYRAQHVLLDRMVAIKMLRPELAADDAFVSRFFAEARAVNLIDHDHVIDVTDFARDANGTPWFVMELLEGADLGAIQVSEPMDLRRALEIVRQLCDALTAVHNAGIVHRDVKPENTFVSMRDGQDFVKLLDFGIARLPDPTSAEPLIGREGMVGTPPYMAPEQVALGEIDHRTDLYAVGVVLFELITGRTPFRRDDMRVLLSDVLFTPPPVPSTLAKMPASVSADLDALILRCLAKEPENRPQSASEIGIAVAALAERLATAALPAAARPASHITVPAEQEPLALALDALEPRDELEPWVRPTRNSQAPIARRSSLRFAAAMAAGAALWLLPLSIDGFELPHIVFRSQPHVVLPAQPSAAAQPSAPLVEPQAPELALPSEASEASAPNVLALNDHADARVVDSEVEHVAGVAEPSAIDDERAHARRAARRSARRSELEPPVLVVTPGAREQEPADETEREAEVLAEQALAIEADRDVLLNPFQR